ncbi:MAG TPA: CYTH domain-containing protein [Rhodanobacteraceae bacterium]|nr:CYTH domain-containing protein [Rhodanobacteraceae bacterium]
MPVEIERKFLVEGDAWRRDVSQSHRMAQGYLAGPPTSRSSVRVRVVDGVAHLNIKSATLGVERDEYEYEIPPADAERMLATLCGERVEKVRHHVRIEGHLFEVDEFLGENAGLVVAEIELDHADEPFPHPDWLGAEVSALARYYNVNLATHPYARWSAEERAARDAT